MTRKKDSAGHEQLKSNLLDALKGFFMDGDPECHLLILKNIALQIECGNEDATIGIMQGIENADERAAFNEILRGSASDIELQATSSDGTAMTLESRLFVIPVVGVLDSKTDQCRLAESDMEALMGSLKKYGLISESDTVALSPYLHPASIIEDSVTKTLEFHESLVNVNTGDTPQIFKDFTDRAIESFPVRNPTIVLKFLIGVIIGPDVEFPDERPDLNPKGDLVDNPQVPVGTPDLRGWLDFAAKILTGYFKDEVNALVELPSTYHTGTVEGVIFHQETSAITAFTKALKNTNTKAAETTLSVIGTDADSQIKLAIFDRKGEPIETVTWQVLGFSTADAERLSLSIISVAGIAGIERIVYNEDSEDRPPVSKMH